MTLAQAMDVFEKHEIPHAWVDEGTVLEVAKAMKAAGDVLAAEIRRRDGETCAWVEDDDAIWHAACGHSFFFDTDGPVENKLEYCCYCGKRGAWQKREGE